MFRNLLDLPLNGKETISLFGGLIGGFITMAFGAWTQGLTALAILMVVDYLTGLIVAGLFKGSKKTESGALESRAGWKGLCRKVYTLILCVVMHQVDSVLGIDYLKNAAVIGFILNELISLVENAGLMGVPMPKAVEKAIDILTAKAESEEE